MKFWKGIFFDMDGVVVDSSSLWSVIIGFMRTRYGLDMEVLDRVSGYNLTAVEAISMILEDMGIYSGDLLSKITGEIDRLYAARLGDLAALEPDMERILAMLQSRGVPAVLVSNSSRTQVGLMLEHFGIEKYFCGIITSDDVTRGKPDPEPYLKALEMTGLRKDEALVVEDSRTGADAASGAGVDHILVVDSPHVQDDGIIWRYGLYYFLDKYTRI